MTTLTILDLAVSTELDSRAMSAVRGGAYAEFHRTPSGYCPPTDQGMKFEGSCQPNPCAPQPQHHGHHGHAGRLGGYCC